MIIQLFLATSLTLAQTRELLSIPKHKLDGSGHPAGTAGGSTEQSGRHFDPDRLKTLRILSDKKRRAFYDSQVGREATVLFEEDIQEGMMQGFTENYVRVVANYDPLLINETLPVYLTAVNADGLMEVVEVAGVFEKH